MDNMLKIRKFSRALHGLLSLLATILPLYYVGYWTFINDWHHPLITVNTPAAPLMANPLPVTLQVAGFCASLLPLSALMVVILNIRKLFSYYMSGVIFSFDHVHLFRKTAKALVLWTVLSIVYESAKSVIFSAGNPPGSRVITVGFSSAEMTTLLVAVIVFIIAWVMDEGRALSDEIKLTV
jgi:hypothetical protein